MSGRAGETSSIGLMTFPDNLSVVKPEMIISGDGGAMRAPLAGPHQTRRDTHV